MAQARSAAEEAGDPSTSAERLLELTEKHPQLHRMIVLNPSCPEVARQWILATNRWAKQAYEASLPAVAADEGPALPEDPEGASVWGDLGTIPAADADADAAGQSPSEAPTTASVRIAEHAGVVPLGASPATATSPADPPSPDPGTGDDGSRTGRRAWYACGGCLLLVLVLVLAVALVGRAWLAGGEDEYQRDSSTTAAEESPSNAPTEEPTQEETTPVDPVSPAPEGAREMTELRSPTGNISCLLEEDSVSCSVLERDFSDTDLQDCGSGPFSIQVAEGEAARACGSSFLSDSAETLEYDDSATYGDMACTSRFDGMTCWNTITGKGFMVNRATYETF
ncbi:hypothetical protein CFK39_11810 [Brachybacterium avium]|uniref:Leucine rich repeat variant domain-containing protein n=1 Tax=Brachybacterium avium TaxID=2017485 RepID=A0A220UE19_9MICO|nr:hypothetical protein [Brachybacterium avium]ASK66387.1 hypothetical protein CFK39_11810 [Brachybacterium avium]